MVVIAYVLNICGKMDSQSFTYKWLNIIGSSMLIINTYYVGAYPSAVVNIIWVLVALYSLGKKK